MAATTCASEGPAGRKVILLASAMVGHATQRRLGKKADGRSLVQPATWPALAELAGEQPSARRHPAGGMLCCNTPHHSPDGRNAPDTLLTVFSCLPARPVCRVLPGF